MTMRDLRSALHLTQKTVAKRLGINQDNISRLEARTDVLLSTLQAYIRSLGGELCLRAEFPNRPPVILSGLNAIENNKS
jgi:predicted transcriptional regulator